MSQKMRLESVLPFALTILLGAFLVFQVQPVFSNSVLPWFGGTPAVWTTCMLFFQVVLFGGYLYAHILTSRLQPRWQVIVHSLMMIAALFSLPIEPDAAWKPVGGESPILYLLCLLLVNIGLPYFVLSSTGPLVQTWLSYRNPDKSVYRLFALSNIGSLVALLSYPVLFEPMLSLSNQSWVWSVGFGIYALCQFVLLAGLWRVTKPVESAGPDAGTSGEKIAPPGRGQLQAWLLLPAFASVMLLAITNHVCQDVAVIPFLWVLPLSIYLLSFIISFDRPAWYRPKLFSAMCVVMMIAWLIADSINQSHWLPIEVLYNMGILFLVCMLCHGEVARIKPHTRYLTRYYLYLSAGGAIGGLFVGLICPLVFSSYVEYSFGMFATAVLAVVMLIANRSWKVIDLNLALVHRLKWVGVAVVLMATLMGARNNPQSIVMERNFFGLVKVLQYSNGRGMLHGNTLHGSQFDAPNHRVATSYFGEQSGIGRTLRYKGQQGPIHTCTCGLGVGTMATYGREGDTFEFIEINPVVDAMAREQFSFLADSAAEVEVHIGDGRLVLERSTDKYDVVAIDVFSSDAVPAHLLTVEAMELYQNRVKEDGLIIVNVINRHLRIAPLVHRLASEIGWHSREIRAESNPEQGMFKSQWVVLAANPEIFNDPIFGETITPTKELINSVPVWTDQYHDLFSLLKF